MIDGSVKSTSGNNACQKSSDMKKRIETSFNELKDH
jgi:hypothetical protein